MGSAQARVVARARPDEWPEEFQKELRQANEEADALRAERRALAGRVAELEQELDQAHARAKELSDRLTVLQRRKRDVPAPRPAGDDWLSGMADRTTNALKSSQEVAQHLVERARQRADEIERDAAQHAAEVRQRADLEAHRTRQVAQFDAEGVLQAAQESAEALLAEAHRARERAVVDFGERQRALHAELARLEAQRRRMLEACAALRRPIDEAIRTLEQAGPNAGSGTAPRRRSAGRAS